jgi:hypothetical protein
MKPSPKNIRFLTLLLTHLHQKRSQQNQGYVMIVVLTLSIALLGLLTAYMLATRVGALTTSSSVASNTGFFVSEAGLNIRAEDAIQKFSGASLPNGTSPRSLEDCFNSASSNRGTSDLGCREFAFDPSVPGSTGRKAYTYMVDTTQYQGTGASRQPPQITVPPNQAFAGLTMQEYSFQIVSASRKVSGADATSSSAAEAITNMEIRARILPLFQFLAFYQNDLEILPGPAAALNGRIHTNSSLFLGADNELRINGQVTAVGATPTINNIAGGLFATRKNALSTNYPDARVKILRTGGNTSTAADWINLKSGGGNPSANPYRITPSTIRSNTGARVIVGFQRIEPPLPALLGTSDTTINGRVQEAEYYNKADLRFRYNPSNSQIPFEIRRVDATSTALPRTDSAVYTAAMDGTSDASVSDTTAREGRQLSRGLLVSLMQPVMAGTNLAAAADPYKIPECTVATNTIGTTDPPINNILTTALDNDLQAVPLTIAQVAEIVRVYQTAVAVGGPGGTPISASQLRKRALATTSGDSPDIITLDQTLTGNTNGYNSTSGGGTIDASMRNSSSPLYSLTSTQKETLKTGLRDTQVMMILAWPLRFLTTARTTAVVGGVTIERFSEREALVRGLQVAIASQPRPIEFSFLAGRTSNALALALNRPDSESTVDGFSVIGNLNRTYTGGSTAFDGTNVAQLGVVGKVLQSPLFSANTNYALTAANATVINSVLNAVRHLTPAEMAAFSYTTSAATGSQQVGQRCFVAPPIQNLNGSSSTRTDATSRNRAIYNDREGTAIGLLQLNLGSLAVWNRDGVYVKISYDGTNLTAATDNTSEGFVANQALFATAAADTGAPAGTFQRNGYSASDTTEGGMVVHASVAPQTPNPNPLSLPPTCNQITYSGTPQTAQVNLCRFGFALTGARQLFGLAATSSSDDPTGLTFVTDAPIYVQGNYNSARTSLTGDGNLTATPPVQPAAEPSLVKQPAAIMGDTLSVFSNNCLHAPTQRIQKFGTDDNCNANDDNTKRGGAYTSINAAFLASVDNTINVSGTNYYNGGLENYPRFLENWGNVLFYRGSFVSLSTPLRSNGRWDNQEYSPPTRRWDYDTSFNLVSNLPPLPPIFRVITQQVFVRQYDR